MLKPAETRDRIGVRYSSESLPALPISFAFCQLETTRKFILVLDGAGVVDLAFEPQAKLHAPIQGEAVVLIHALKDDVGSFRLVDQSPIELTGGCVTWYVRIHTYSVACFLHVVLLVAFDCQGHEVLRLELETSDETLLWLC